IRMAKQVARNPQSIRRNIEGFPRADASYRAGGHVSHGVPASLARGESGSGQSAHRRRHAFGFAKVELNIFARRKVTAPGRVLIRKPGKHAQLFWPQYPGRNLHAQHLETRLPLAVRAMLQAKRPKLLFGDGTDLELLDALFKTSNLRFDGFRSMPLCD